MNQVPTLEELSGVAAEAEKLSQDPRLGRALGRLFAGEPSQAKFALTAPREYLATVGVDLPEYLDVATFRSDPRLPIEELPGKFVPDFEFFNFRLFNCRTYWVAQKDADGKVTGYDKEEICWGFEFTPKFLPGGPIS